MTPEILNELRELEAQATPEPWTVTHRCVGCSPRDDERWGLGLEIQGPPEADGRGQFKRGADARLIAELRNNAKALLAAYEAKYGDPKEENK